MLGKIYVKIMGGLGNQLFQFAYALKIQKLFPDKTIVIDHIYFNKKHIRSMELQQLSIDNVEWDNSRHFFYDLSYSFYSILVRVANKLGFVVKSISFLENRGFIYSYSKTEYHMPKSGLKNYYLGGYFQNENEIRSVKNEMYKVIEPKSVSQNAKIILNQIQSNRSIGVSIRIGEDYQNFGWPICSREYYENGIEYILNKHGKDCQLVIFSDNIKKIQEEKWFVRFDLDIIYVEKCSACEGLYLLSKCNDFVIANSTFSWWGAYLGLDNNKLIIAPERFFSKNKMCESGLHIPGAVYMNNKS